MPLLPAASLMESLLAVRQSALHAGLAETENNGVVLTAATAEERQSDKAQTIASVLASDIACSIPCDRRGLDSYDNAAIFDSIHCCARSFTSRGSAPAGSIGGPMTRRMVPDRLNNPRRGQ